MKGNNKTNKYRTSKSVNKAYRTEELLLEKCDAYGLSGNIIGDTMFVTTAIGKWHFRLNYNHERIKLYHSNLFRKSRRNKFGNDYHLQDIRFYNPMEVLEYIHNHDRNGFGYMKTSKAEKVVRKAV